MLHFKDNPFFIHKDKLHADTIDLLISKATPEISSFFNISKGTEILKFRQLISIDDSPSIISDTYCLSNDDLLNLDDPSSLSFEKLLQTLSNDSLLYCIKCITAIPSDLTVQHLLGIDFVLKVTELIKTTKGDCICIHDLYMNPEYCSVSLDTFSPYTFIL